MEVTFCLKFEEAQEMGLVLVALHLKLEHKHEQLAWLLENT